METFGKSSEPLLIDRLVVVAAQGRVQGPSGHGRLEPRVMDLLVYLASHRGVVVTRDAIIRDVWRGMLVTDAVISRSIHQIRKLFTELGVDAALLETIPKRGYRLASAPAGDGAEPTATQPVPQAPRGRNMRAWLAGAIGGCTVLGVIALLVLRGVTSPRVADPLVTAQRLYLQGQAYARRNEPGAYQQAAGYFHQATVENPRFAAAYAAAAISELLQVDMGNRPAAEAVRAAREPAQRALQLDSQLPETQAATGLIAYYSGDYDGAAEALRRATALRPDYAQAQMWLGRVAMRQWQVQRAVASFERARELDPDSPMTMLNCGLAYDLAGRWTSAVSALERGVELNPRLANLYWELGRVRWQQGELVDAEKNYARAIELGGDYSTLYSQYAVLLSDLGRGKESAPWLARSANMYPADDWLWIAQLTGIAPTPASNAGSPAARARAEILEVERSAARGDLQGARSRLAQLDLKSVEMRRLLHDGWLAHAGHLPLLDLASIYLRSGDEQRGRELTADAHEWLSDMRDRGLDSAGMDYDSAALAALEGDREHALLYLRSAVTRHWREAASMARDPKFASLHRDPGFAALKRGQIYFSDGLVRAARTPSAEK